MREFKFFKDNDTQSGFTLLTNRLPVFIPQVRYDNAEFCFQFDDEEPTVFAHSTGEITLRIAPSDGGNITFTANDKQFKIFARERQ